MTLHKSYSLEEIQEIINVGRSEKELQQLGEKLGRTLLAIKFLRVQYNRFRKNPTDVRVSDALQKTFAEVIKSPQAPQSNPLPQNIETGKSFLTPLTLEMVKDLIDVSEGKMDKQDFMEKHHKTQRRTDFLIYYHKSWLKNRKPWSNNRRVAELFEQYYAGLSNPEVAVPAGEINSESDESQDNSFSEIDEVFNKFKENLAEALIKTVKKMNEKEKKESFEKGYTKGKDEGEKLFRAKTIGTIIKEKIFNGGIK